MFELINERLQKVKEDCHFADKWEKRQSELESELMEAREQSKKMRLKWEKEQKDVDKLEDWTITRFFVSLTGKKEERLEVEKEEALKIKLLFENSQRVVERLEQELDTTIHNLEGLDQPYKKFEQLIKEKETLIQSSDSPLTNLIYNLSEQMSVIKVQEKETEEAIHAAGKAKDSLEVADSELHSAKNWGYMDLAGGDFLSTLAKRSHMDHASSAIQVADHDLRKLNKELAEINRESNETMQLSGFLGIADYFFDNIFTDLAVQNRINNAILKVENTLSKINDIILELKMEKDQLKAKWDETREKRDREIELIV